MFELEMHAIHHPKLILAMMIRYVRYVCYYHIRCYCELTIDLMLSVFSQLTFNVFTINSLIRKLYPYQ